MIEHGMCEPIRWEAIQDIPEHTLREMYAMLYRIRRVEEKVADLVADGEISCPCHLYIGQEAVATGVCFALTREDYVYSTHRSHGHYLAKGGDVAELMAELFCRETGCSRGHGGSMHLVAPHIGFPGSSAIVAGTIPLAVGTALSFSIRQQDSVAVAFFGDGAATEGVFYESLNFAALRKLPVIFVCENNFYSTHMHISSIQSNMNIYTRAAAFGIPAVRIDGNNIVEVYEAARRAVESARRGEGPFLIECVTYRWRGHVGPNWDIEKGLRSREEVDWWIGRCALQRFEHALVGRGVLQKTECEEIKHRVASEVEEAVLFAKKSPFPETTDSLSKVFRRND